MSARAAILAYHFVGKTLRDGRPIPADGEWLVHDGEVEICKSGLHASKCPFDALKYAPGETLCLVECEDIVEEGGDKFVCRRRRIIKRIDATDLLWSMARWSALQVIHLWNAPAVVREYLETGREELQSAAWITARDAARGGASWAAAWAAAMAASGEAAWAASKAARITARDAARAASRAIRGEQRAEFRRRVDEAFA